MLATNAEQLVGKRTLAGDWAGYHLNVPAEYVFCGWMGLHDDRGDTAEFGRLWGLRPYYWDDDAVFLHTLPKELGGGLQVVERTDLDVFFRADLRHGLVKVCDLDSILRRRSTKHVEAGWRDSEKARLVWRWVSPDTGLEFVNKRPESQLKLDGWVAPTGPGIKTNAEAR